MTMDDYEGMVAYWAAHPPLQTLAEYYFKIKPKRVRRKRAVAAEPQAAPQGVSWTAAFPDGIIR